MYTKQAVSKLLDEIEAAIDHVTHAFDISHENNMPTKQEELLGIKRHLLELKKELDWQYKTMPNA